MSIYDYFLKDAKELFFLKYNILIDIFPYAAISTKIPKQYDCVRGLYLFLLNHPKYNIDMFEKDLSSIVGFYSDDAKNDAEFDFLIQGYKTLNFQNL